MSEIKRRNKGGPDRDKRLNVYLDPPTKERLAQASDDESISMNEIIRESITQRIRDKERYGANWIVVRSWLDRLDPEQVVSALATVAKVRK